MDRFHIILIVLLGISIVFLGISAISPQSVLKSTEEPEIWTMKITPAHLNTIADIEFLTYLKKNSSLEITGDDLTCLNICGNRCLWLGYTFKSYEVEPGTFLWGDKENAICTCSCYVIKK